MTAAASQVPPERHRPPSHGRRRVPGDIGDAALDQLPLGDLQLLSSVASGERAAWQLPRRLERSFQRYVRRTSAPARVAITLFTLALFLAAPVWVPLLLGGNAAQHPTVLLMIYGVVAPLFVVTAWVQRRWVERPWAEWVLLFSFAVEMAAIEFLRYRSDISGEPLNASLPLLVPLAVVSLARIRLSRVALFFAAYIGVVLGMAALFRYPASEKDASTWMMEVLVLGVVCGSTAWSAAASRQQWAAMITLRAMAFRDALTGLPNRRAFDDHYDVAMRALQRLGQPDRTMVLALIDLDHFKRINDQYGHGYGDGVLSELGVALSQFARRPLDLAARIGGEEFALLLYDCSARDGLERAQSLCTLVRDMGIENHGTPGGVVTCSIGLVAVPIGTPLSEAYRWADQGLYQAKRQGRDQVVPVTPAA